MTDLDFALALFAARTYGTRNFSVYGKSPNLFMSRTYAKFAEYTLLLHCIFDSITVISRLDLDCLALGYALPLDFWTPGYKAAFQLRT